MKSAQLTIARRVYDTKTTISIIGLNDTTIQFYSMFLTSKF